MRPDVVAYAAGKFNYSLWMGAALVLGSARCLTNFASAWLRNPLSRLLILMIVPLFISCQLAPFREDADSIFSVYIRMTVACLTVPLLITDISNLKILYLVTGMSLGFHGLWRGTVGLLQGGFRMQAGIGGFMTENNTFGCGLVMVLPFIWCTREVVKTPWLRLLLLWMTFGTICTIIWTFSRGAAVGLAALLLLFVFYSRHKASLVVLALVALGPVVYLVGDRYVGRMSTVVDYEADRSVLSRLELMKVAPRIWAEKPWFGVGLGNRNFFIYSNSYLSSDLGRNLVVHNSYLQILVHGGIFAFLIFNIMLFGTMWRATKSAKEMRRVRPELEPYPRAIQASLVGFAVCSLTQPRAMFDLFYMVVAYAAAWHAILPTLGQAAASAAASRVTLPARAAAGAALSVGRG